MAGDFERLRRELRRWRTVATPTGLIDRLTAFLTRTIWVPAAASPTWKRWLYRGLQAPVLAISNMRSNRQGHQAAALTYRTLLALVPTLAVTFTLLQMLGGFDDTQSQLREWLLQYLAPGFHDQIAQNLDLYIARVRSQATTTSVVGSLLVLWTVLRTLETFDSALQRTFGQGSRRPLLRRLLTYWSVATLGPIMVGTSVAVSASLQSATFVTQLQDSLPEFVSLGYRVIPLVLACLAFSLLYAVLGSANLSKRAALVGGGAAGLLFELSKWGFAEFAEGLLTSRAAIYGPVGTLFVFLLWIYVSWYVVLIGAEIAVAMQSASSYLAERQTAHASITLRQTAAVLLYSALSKAYVDKLPAPSATALAAELAIPHRFTVELLAELEVVGLIARVEGELGYGFIPSAHPGRTSLSEVVSAIAGGGSNELRLDVPVALAGVLEALAAGRRAEGACLSEHTVEDLLATPTSSPRQGPDES